MNRPQPNWQDKAGTGRGVSDSEFTLTTRPLTGSLDGIARPRHEGTPPPLAPLICLACFLTSASHSNAAALASDESASSETSIVDIGQDYAVYRTVTHGTGVTVNRRSR